MASGLTELTSLPSWLASRLSLTSYLCLDASSHELLIGMNHVGRVTVAVFVCPSAKTSPWASLRKQEVVDCGMKYLMVEPVEVWVQHRLKGIDLVSVVDKLGWGDCVAVYTFVISLWSVNEKSVAQLTHGMKVHVMWCNVKVSPQFAFDCFSSCLPSPPHLTKSCAQLYSISIVVEL